MRGAFLFLGRPDQVFDLDRTPALPDWSPDRRLEITAPDGPLVFVRETTHAPPPAQFHRTAPVR